MEGVTPKMASSYLVILITTVYACKGEYITVSCNTFSISDFGGKYLSVLMSNQIDGSAITMV